MRSTDRIFLREDVRAEPLVHAFHAWPHLLAPHTYACNLIAKHLPALRRHLATANQEGDGARGAEVRRLLSALEHERPGLLRFGDAIRVLDALLLAKARGLELDALYSQVPPPIRGLVELAYDRHNRPGIRFLEGALYLSPFYDPSLQGVRIERVDPDEPGEPLQEPRLSRSGRLMLPVRFDSELWDILGRARREPLPVADLALALGAPISQLSSLVSESRPRRVLRTGTTGPAAARALFLGHACVLLQTAQASVLVDPLLAHRPHGRADRFSFADLPERIDCIAITHGHLDHMDIETLLQIRHLVGHVVVPRTGGGDLLDPSLRLILQAMGFTQVRELGEFESLELPGVSVTAVPFLGEHSDLTVRGKAAYVVAIGGRRHLLVADSRCLEPRIYEMVREHLGPVDALFVGMECEGSPMATASGPYLPAGLCTPAMSEARRTRGSDAASALALVRASGTGRAYVYAMGLEPWFSYMFGVPDPTRSRSLAQIEAFLGECHAIGVDAELLRGPRVLTFDGVAG